MSGAGAQEAWVVGSRWPGAPGVVTSAHASEEEAGKNAEELREHGFEVVSVSKEPDLNPEEIYRLFVERLGVETSPGTIRIAWGENCGVEIVVDPQWVATIYNETDPYDDTHMFRTQPKALHPRRLALENLLLDLLELTLPAMEDRPLRYRVGP